MLFEKKIVTEIKKKQQLTKDFNNICDLFADNKLSIHFGEDKMKSFLPSFKRNLKLLGELDLRYNKIKIKQHKHVNYLGCMLDETMPSETVALRVTEKVNSRLKFLLWFLDVPLCRFLGNALMQPHFDYGYTAW